MPGSAPLHIERVTVGPQRVDVVVNVGGADADRTSPAIAERVIELLPGLGTHRCVNAEGRTFAEELADTEVPHLFEHVVLELMALAGSPRSLKGETAWDFRRDGAGVFHVSLEYDDDLVCLGAIKAADEIMRYALSDGPIPDTHGIAASLRALRVWPS